MSKYLVTLTKGEFSSSSSGYTFRDDVKGNSSGRIKIETQICEFEHEYPTESEINRVTKYHPRKVSRLGTVFNAYYEYHILFMQKLEDKE